MAAIGQIQSYAISTGDITPTTTYTQALNRLRTTFASGRTKDIVWRKQQLSAVRRFLEDQSDLLIEALTVDLRKSRMESILFDIEFSINDVKGALAEIDEWVKPRKVSRNFMTSLDKAYVLYEPLGLCLVMGAWNYPVQLLLSPIIGAIAAGNVAVLKPSDLAPATAGVMERLIGGAYLDADAFLVVNGGAAECTELLSERFDHIFYTGSTAIGKVVYQAAQKHLTPVILELGGKSPLYLDRSVNLEVATKRILWGKWVNAGQTCVAPDYVLCHSDVYDKFIDTCKKVTRMFYGSKEKEAAEFGRIVNTRHVERLEHLLKDQKILFGGCVDYDTRYVAPTIVLEPSRSDPIMCQEIFGPILPTIKVRDITEAIAYISKESKPLTSYVFSTDSRIVKRFIEQTTSGSVCVNDVLVHLSLDSLPFGGVGNSGMGRYHGRYSFEAFSNPKAVLERNFNIIGEYLGSRRYPPNTESSLRLFRGLLAKRALPLSNSCRRAITGLAPYVIGALLGAAASYTMFNDNC